MKGNDKVIAELQKALAAELTGTNQYILHAAMFENWEFGRLAGAEKKRAYAEMKHVDALLDRILFLDGKPVIDKPLEVKIGTTVESILSNDAFQERKAIKDYNAAIEVAVAEGDNGSRELFESHLQAEEEHLNFIEAQLYQIKVLGLSTYLAEQLKD